MWLSDTSVKRPVFATVLSLLLLVLGTLAFMQLSIREYPNISPPVVSIFTEYPGASADIIESRITQVLEGRLVELRVSIIFLPVVVMGVQVLPLSLTLIVILIMQRMIYETVFPRFVGGYLMM